MLEKDMICMQKQTHLLIMIVLCKSADQTENDCYLLKINTTVI